METENNPDQMKNRQVGVGVILLIAIIAILAGSNFTTDTSTESGEIALDESCNVLVFSVKGYLSTYVSDEWNKEEMDITSSEDIVSGILVAGDEPDIKAVLVSIDSIGGDGVAGEEIANALKALDKPSVALIRGVGASAAYWAATGADRIFASKMSDVGSIGVTASYLDESVKNQKDGYTYNELSSAKYKNTGDPSRPLSQEEKTLLMEDIRKAHEIFVQAVATNRNLEIENVAKFANGLTYMGEDAVQNGLIDEIGDLIVATKYIESVIGEEVDFCMY